jgi:hypothetical protein
MPNGKPGDNPLSDMIVHGTHPFPRDIEKLLRRIEKLGHRPGCWPLGQNWPYSPREYDWAQGENLDEARRLLTELVAHLEAGRGDEILVHPLTREPLSPKGASLPASAIVDVKKPWWRFW